MDRIVIIGSPGAGKSTLARTLGSMLDMKVIHLDRYFWKPGWKEYPRDERARILQELVKIERWIIEGTYLSTSDIRINAADMVVFLDMPTWLCLYRVIRRRFQDARKQRSDLPDGCTERLRPLYLLKMLAFRQKDRRLLLSKIQSYEKNEQKGKSIYQLRTQKDIDLFLKNLPSHSRPICASRSP